MTDQKATHAKLTQASIISDVIDERNRQDKKYGGAPFDDRKSMDDWIRILYSYLYRLDGWICHHGVWRKKLIQIAALAIAAVESIDRRHQGEGE